MRNRNLHRPLLLLLAFSVWSLTPVRTAMADITYDATVDTSSLKTVPGYIDFQLNPANSNSSLALAVVSNFATDGSVGPVALQQGDAAGPSMGPLSGQLLFDIGSPLNELTYSFIYGTTFSFDVTLSGPALSPGGSASSTFALRLLDPAMIPFSTGPGGAIVTIVANPDGSTTGTAFSPSAVPGPTATVIEAGTVPEPSTLVLGAIAFGALFGCHQVRRRAAD